MQTKLALHKLKKLEMGIVMDNVKFSKKLEEEKRRNFLISKENLYD